MRERCETRAHITSLRRHAVEHEHGVFERVPLRMECLRLRLADERCKLRERHIEHARAREPAEKSGRLGRAERAAQLGEDALARLTRKLRAAGAHIGERLLRDLIAEERRLPRRAQRAHGILDEMRGNRPHAAACDVLPPAVEVDEPPLGQLERDAVHRRVPAIEILLDRDLRRERDGKTAIARPCLALPSRERHLRSFPVHRHQVDGERAADALRVRKERAERRLADAAHDVILVRGRCTAQTVAHPAAHDEDARAAPA